jgi:hypothetical protein
MEVATTIERRRQIEMRGIEVKDQKSVNWFKISRFAK